MRLPTRVSRLVLSATMVALALTGLPWVHADAAQPRVAIAARTTLPAQSTLVPGTRTAGFDLVLASRDPAGEAAFLHDIVNPRSPNYRHFLSPAAFAARFGATTTSVARVRNYLARFGLTSHALSRGGVLLPVTGPTAAIGHAFATQVRTVRLATGTLATALASAATVPATLAHDIVTAVGLSPSVPRTTSLRAHTTTTSPSAPSACAGAGASTGPSPNVNGYTVQQEGAAYGLTTLWHNGTLGQGTVIGLYELGVTDTPDTAVYFRCYGLSPHIITTKVDGGATGAFSDEATMDVEQAAALAPGATIHVYGGPNTGSAPVDVYARIADDDSVTVVATSWGDCELDPNGAILAEQAIFEQMAAEGITVIAAAGDSGSSDCTGITSNTPAVDDPASQPLVTAVGGLTVPSLSPLHATVWNSGGGASGGGVSTQWSRPWWQRGSAFTGDTSQGVATAAGRMVPDLAVLGDPATGFVQYFTGNDTATVICKGQSCKGGWSGVGGTSMGAPLVGALVALATQTCGVTRLGFINPTLYAGATSGSMFTDITTGSNDLLQQHAYSAGVGFDLASGLGTPTTSFVTSLCPAVPSATQSVATLPPAPVLTNAPTSLSVTVRSAAGTPIPNTAVTFSATGSVTAPQFNGIAGSQASATTATITVQTSATGIATVSFSAASAGTATITETAGGVTVATQSLNVVTLASLQVPPPKPTITGARVNGRSALITVAFAAAYFPVVAYVVSVTNGKTTTTLPAASTLIVRGLLPARGYDLRIRARNAYGDSPWSAPFHIRTLG